MKSFNVTHDVGIEFTDDEMFVFSQKTSLIHVFNGTAAFIMKQIQQGKDTDGIIAALTDAYIDVDQTTLEQDLNKVLDVFMEQQIITPVPEAV